MACGNFVGCFPEASRFVFGFTLFYLSVYLHRLIGLVVKVSASRAEDSGFESCLRQDFSGSSNTSDFKIGTPVATLPGTWHYRVSAGTGQLGVSILWLGEVESLICNFCLSVADLFLRYTSMLLGCWATNQQTNCLCACCMSHACTCIVWHFGWLSDLAGFAPPIVGGSNPGGVRWVFSGLFWSSELDLPVF